MSASYQRKPRERGRSWSVSFACALWAGAGLVWGGENTPSQEGLPWHYKALPLEFGWKEPSTADLAAEAKPQAGQAVVRAISNGYADYSEDGKTWNRLTIGHILRSGHTVTTDKDAEVDLYLGSNGPVVRVTPDTLLGFRKLSFRQSGAQTVIETVLDLSRGRILGSVKRLSPRSTYEIVTPFGVVAVRGTQYEVSANGRVTVIQGVALLRTPQGRVLARVNQGSTALFPSYHPNLKRLFGD